MIAYDNVIVTDCDGVLIFWEHGFHMWMVSKGYKETSNGFYNIEQKYGISKEEAGYLMNSFNDSAALRKLPPMRDAIKYVRKLHEDHGYVFHCITAIPNTRDMYEARLENLENLFGKTAIERLTLCGASTNKKQLLKEYEDTGCFWIEDVVENFEYGTDCGMTGLLMDHHYNRTYIPSAPHKRVFKWKDIYETIVG